MSSLYCNQGHLNPLDSRFCRLCGEPLPSLPEVPQAIAGQLLGWRYRVVAELGQGGFGRTYLAEDTNRFNEPCVLKEFAPQVQGTDALQKAEELFEREAGILYRLQHAQIPRFRELFKTEWQGRQQLFLVQDFVDGQTYHDLLKIRRLQGHSFSEVEIVQLLFQLLPVLDYIHSAAVLHRDISPDNLIQRLSDGLPVLIDFGGVKRIAARVVSSSAPAIAPLQPGTITRLGKVGYAPAEQLEQGEVFPHSDLYALAVTMLVLLTGKEPQELFGTNAGINRHQWQRDMALSPSLTAILARMLEPYPERRYQSAQEVMQTLEEAGYQPPQASPDHPLPPLGEPIAVFMPKPATPGFAAPGTAAESATIAISPARAATQAVMQPAAQPRPQRKGMGKAIAKTALFAGLILGGWWVGVKWLGPALKSKLPEIVHPGDQPQSKVPTVKPTDTKPKQPDFSKSEQTRKQQIEARRNQLGVDNAFLSKLVNQTFFVKHPERKGQPLGADAADAELRAEWDQLALQSLDRLESLSQASRSRLGQYTTADVGDRGNAASQLNVSSRTLNDLTDASFFHLFPEQTRGENLLDQPIGQVWQAIATDQLKALQTGATLEKIEFSPGNLSHQVSGTLQPGSGKVYIANLSQNQTFRLQLQPANQPLLISFYPPSSKIPALLKDSKESTWTGKLTEPGFYELVVVSDSKEPGNYAIDLAATE